MEKETKFLKDWSVRYIKNKDIITRKIVSVNEQEDSFVIERKDKTQKLFVIPFLKNVEDIVDKVREYEHSKGIFCFHTRENFDFLIKNWGYFVDLGRNFTMNFVNPFSKLDRVLSLSPYTHYLISDAESLKEGLKTMAENVEFATEEEIKKIVSS